MRGLAAVVRPHLGVLRQHAPRQLRIPARYERERLPVDPPVISIVTPSLNQAQYIERTIRSILDQRYPSLDYVIQDGGSTDGSVAIINRYADALSHWESAEDPGQAAAINAGFRHARGEILAYLNADDVLLPGTLARVARHFAKHPATDVVYGHRVLIDAEDKEIGRWVLPRHDDAVVRWVDFIPQETVFWRRRIWDAAGPLNESLRFAIDWDLILRMSKAGARFVRLPRFLGALRVHDEQKTSAMWDTGSREVASIRTCIHGRHVTQAEILANIWPYIAKHVFLERAYRMRLLRY